MYHCRRRNICGIKSCDIDNLDALVLILLPSFRSFIKFYKTATLWKLLCIIVSIFLHLKHANSKKQATFVIKYSQGIKFWNIQWLQKISI